MIGKLVIAAMLAQACSSVQKVVTLPAPQPQTVVIYVHDSSAPSHSKYLADLRPNGRTKYDAALPWVAEYKAPASYALWWKEIADCEKVALPVELTSKVHWVGINAETFRVAPAYETLYGLTDPEAVTIFLAESKANAKDVVTHEMAHMLNSWNGIDEGKDYHPYNTFEECSLHVTYP